MGLVQDCTGGVGVMMLPVKLLLGTTTSLIGVRASFLLVHVLGDSR